MSANEIPEWAWKRVREMVPEARLAERHFRDLHAAQAFARYIAAHEEAPVDPLLIEARRLIERWWPGEGALEGKLDGSMWSQRLLLALRRGIELAKAGEA